MLKGICAFFAGLGGRVRAPRRMDGRGGEVGTGRGGKSEAGFGGETMAEIKIERGGETRDEIKLERGGEVGTGRGGKRGAGISISLPPLLRQRSLLRPALLLFIAAAAFSPAADAFADKGARAIQVEYQNLTIKLGGRTIIPQDANGSQVHPFLHRDRTYMPIRALANALGCSVSWNQSAAAAEIRKDGSGKPIYGEPAGKQSKETITVQYNDISIIIDGKKAALENEPFTYVGTTYLPLREIADALGCAVDYEHETRTILIEPAPERAKPSASASLPLPASSPSPSPSPVPAGSFSSADFSFAIGGSRVKLDENVSAALKLLGDGYEYMASPSCAYVGEDKLYSYDGIDVSTLPIDGDLICSIDVTSSSFKTSKSITVGSSLRQVVAAYGSDYTLEMGTLVYWGGEKGNPRTPQLYFVLDGGDSVEAFGMYNGKSAG
jgi:hypothetical protein